MTPYEPTSNKETAALEIVWRLHQAGFRAYWVGGSVRNRLLGLPVEDIDVATEARPDQIYEIFRNVRTVGAKFGVCLVQVLGIATEVATFRSEGPYLDHRRPDSVAFEGPEEDVRRRDFTMNALFFDPIEERIVDYVGGQTDIAARVVRCVGDPDRRFDEDALRILRAVRFAARLDFSLDPATREALVAHREDLRFISAERIRDELVRMMTSPRASHALELLSETGVLDVVLPEVAAMRGVPQPPEYHPEGDVWTHTKDLLDHLPSAPSPLLAMSALLHDVGKPPTFKQGDDRIRFHQHAEVGAEIAEAICFRLRFSNADTEAIAGMVRRHMKFRHVRDMRPATLLRFLDTPTIDDEIVLHRADCLASHGHLDNYEHAKEKLEAARIAHARVLPPPLIGGHDLLAMGFRPGPLFGEILHVVQEHQLEGMLATPGQARAWVETTYGSRRDKAR